MATLTVMFIGGMVLMIFAGIASIGRARDERRANLEAAELDAWLAGFHEKTPRPRQRPLRQRRVHA